MNAVILLFDFGGKCLELGFGARDQNKVPSFPGQLEGILFSQAVRGSCDHNPAALGSILPQLLLVSIDSRVRSSEVYILAGKDKQAEKDVEEAEHFLENKICPNCAKCGEGRSRDLVQQSRQLKGNGFHVGVDVSCKRNRVEVVEVFGQRQPK